MAIINEPPVTPVDSVDARGVPQEVNYGWRNFFSAVYLICGSVASSGTTAQRPTKALFAGRPYFDTTLGKPIWYKSAGWVDATGAAA